MTESDVILKLEIVPGRAPQVDAVAQALRVWGQMLSTAAGVVDPLSIPSIELVGVEDGSQVFKIALKKAVGAIQAGAREYPLVEKSAITLAALIPTTIVTVGITIAMTPDPRIPKDQMAVFEKTNKLLEESIELQRQNREFYTIVHDDPAFASVKVLRGRDKVIVYEIPRSEFAARSGVWAPDVAPEPDKVEVRHFSWDVMLIKPVLEAKPRRWVFARQGVKFSAVMSDKRVLEAIHDKTMPIQVAEGVAMKVQGEYKERFDGETWLPVDGSMKVTRVLDPAPPSRSLPLFPASGGPEK